MEKCLFCEKEVTYRIDGFAFQGEEDGYVCQLVCDEHVKSYIDWFFDDAQEADERIHGLEYVDTITLYKPNKAEVCQNCDTKWKFHDPRVCSVQLPNRYKHNHLIRLL